jgi:aspartate kinase
MSLIVQKFGGTSLADPQSRANLVRKARAARERGDEIVLVVSAMGRRGDPYATDSLLDLLNEFPGSGDPLTRDLMASCGEVVSACVIAALLESEGIKAIPMTAASAGLYARGSFGDAEPLPINPEKLQAALLDGFVPVVTGFQGLDDHGNIRTLGRGGSDTSAVAIGVALDANFVDIYKDVPGVAKADPRIIPQAPFMDFLDYESMFRLANHGARVLHDKSALLAMRSEMPIRIRSTFDDGEGTLIGKISDERAVPHFIGLATSPGPSGSETLRVSLVFAKGEGSHDIQRALDFASSYNPNPKRLESVDPDAVVFLCEQPTGKDFARSLYSLFG